MKFLIVIQTLTSHSSIEGAGDIILGRPITTVTFVRFDVMIVILMTLVNILHYSHDHNHDCHQA